MNDTKNLQKRLRAFRVPFSGVPNFVEAEYLTKEAADALEALRAEVVRLRGKGASLDRLRRFSSRKCKQLRTNAMQHLRGWRSWNDRSR